MRYEADTMKAQILGYTNGQWPKFHSAREIKQITGVDEARLIDYAKNGLCPHVKIDGKTIRFMKSHIIRWLRENVLDVCEGRSLEPIPVLVSEMQPANVPKQLHLAAHRLVEVSQMSGIYFLCQGDTIVYVGQSINVASRIKQHGNKEFDRALCLPCPEEELNRVEAAFISLLKPPLNKAMHNSGVEIFHNADGQAFANPHKIIEACVGKQEAA